MSGHFDHHPGHHHPLSWGFKDDNGQPVDIKCHGCGRYMPDDENYFLYCPKDGCEYYLDRLCYMLAYCSEINHPLHPQHPLIPYFNGFPNDQTQFACSFCTKTTTSGFLLHCAQCEFYLDIACSHTFEQNQLFTSKYEFPHFLHCQENHTLLPHRFPDIYPGPVVCQGCGLNILPANFVFKCTRCDYYLHVPCSRVPKEMKHPFHPQHTLTLLERPPDDFKQELRCTACRKRMEDEFVLHCTECPFNLDIGCAFLKPTMKSEHHEHPLAYFDELHTKDVLCAITNTLLDGQMYRCLICNFNIHSSCLLLPETITYDDHVHPFTLTSSFKENDSGVYYCDMCEERRDPDHAVYLCKECPYTAHPKCVLPMETIEELKKSFPQELLNFDYLKTEEISPTADEAVSQYTILSQLDMEMANMREMVKELLNKTHIEEVTEKLKKLEESRAKAEGMVRQLGKSSFTETG